MLDLVSPQREEGGGNELCQSQLCRLRSNIASEPYYLFIYIINGNIRELTYIYKRSRGGGGVGGGDGGI